MSDEFEFEEEEFSTQFNGRTVLRILAQATAALALGRRLSGVPLPLVSGLDSFFTFLSKQIVDEGIVAGDRTALTRIVTLYGCADRRPGRRRLWLYLPGRHPGRAHPLRPAQEDVQPPAGPVLLLL